MPFGRVFGGQVMAQAVVAAQRTVDPARPIHSVHGYFVRPGDVELPITFSVERIHDGRSFSTRRVQAYQRGLPIMSMISSFQDVDEGPARSTRARPGCPSPEELPSSEDLLAPYAGHPQARAVIARPFDIRHVEGPVYVPRSLATAARQAARLGQGEGAAARRGRAAPRRDRLPLRLRDARADRADARRRVDDGGAARPRASTTPSGGTGPRGSTTGCCSSSRRSRRAAAAGSRAASSTPPTARTSRPSPRRAWCGSRGRRRAMRVDPIAPAEAMRALRGALPLRTERLLLRTLRPDDLEAVRGYRNAPGQRRWTYTADQTEAELDGLDRGWCAGVPARRRRGAARHRARRRCSSATSWCASRACAAGRRSSAG